MKRENRRKLAYKMPITNILQIDEESIMCETSVHPTPAASTEEGWENEEEIDGGDMEL